MHRMSERATPVPLLSVLVLVYLLSGCSQLRYELGTRLSPDALPDPGQEVSLAEMLASLGPPHRLSAVGSGYVAAWEFWQIREDSIGISLGALGADLMSMDWGRGHMQGDFLLVTFNRQHRVTGSSFARWSSDAGGGRAIQPFGLVSLADVEDLLDQMPQHQWGAALLESLPRMINSSSRPDTGQNGIQRRGTPTGTGQQSLD